MEVSIRDIKLDDAKDVQVCASHPGISATSNVPHPYPVNGGADFVRASMEGALSGTSRTFAVLASNQFAGVMTLNAINKADQSASLDYWIAVPYWGRGIATKAAGLAVKVAFEDLGLRLLRSGGLSRNIGSMRVLEKNGFNYVDSVVHQGQRFFGERISRYELSAERWKAS